MKKIELIVKTKTKNYPIIIGSNIIKEIEYILKSKNITFEKCFIIYDTKVPKKNLITLKKKIKCKKKTFIFLMQVKKIKT